MALAEDKMLAYEVLTSKNSHYLAKFLPVKKKNIYIYSQIGFLKFYEIFLLFMRKSISKNEIFKCYKWINEDKKAIFTKIKISFIEPSIKFNKMRENNSFYLKTTIKFVIFSIITSFSIFKELRTITFISEELSRKLFDLYKKDIRAEKFW